MSTINKFGSPIHDSNALCGIYDKVEEIDEVIDVLLDAPFGANPYALSTLYKERGEVGRVPDALSKINDDSGKKGCR